MENLFLFLENYCGGGFRHSADDEFDEPNAVDMAAGALKWIGDYVQNVKGARIRTSERRGNDTDYYTTAGRLLMRKRLMKHNFVIRQLIDNLCTKQSLKVLKSAEMFG